MPLFGCHAEGHWAGIARLAPPDVVLEEGLNEYARIAPAARLDFAACPVPEHPLHVSAVGRRALGRPARGQVQQ